MRPLLFAANWKMHLGPDDARSYLKTFRARCNRRADREVWFFPPAVSVEAAAQAAGERADLLVGVQDIYWEPKGAFTGAISAPLALQAGARAAFVAAALLPGRPLLYDGQEVESPQKLGLFERDPIAWDQPNAAAARIPPGRNSIPRQARTRSPGRYRPGEEPPDG